MDEEPISTAKKVRAEAFRYHLIDQGFNAQNQEVVIKLIDAMIVKQQVGSAMQPVGKAKRR